MTRPYDRRVPPISVRLPVELIEQVDALVEHHNATEFGRTTRASMLQELVRVGLRRLEAGGRFEPLA